MSVDEKRAELAKQAALLRKERDECKAGTGGASVLAAVLGYLVGKVFR